MEMEIEMEMAIIFFTDMESKNGIWLEMELE